MKIHQIDVRIKTVNDYEEFLNLEYFLLVAMELFVQLQNFTFNRVNIKWLAEKNDTFKLILLICK